MDRWRIHTLLSDKSVISQTAEEYTFAQNFNQQLDSLDIVSQFNEMSLDRRGPAEIASSSRDVQLEMVPPAPLPFKVKEMANVPRQQTFRVVS